MVKDMTISEARKKICPYAIANPNAVMAGECLANACQAWVVTNEGGIEVTTTSIRSSNLTQTKTEMGVVEDYRGEPRPPEGDDWEEITRADRRQDYRLGTPFYVELRWTEATFRRPCEPRGYCSAFHKET